MHRPPLTQDGRFLREGPCAPCRVEFRTVPATTCAEQTGRLDAIWATGCTIQTPLPLDASATVELRIDLPDGQGALHIDRARITWSRWTSFTVEFVTLSADNQSRLEAYLATSQEIEWT